ncbi:Exopolysaccharide biosynthesis protein related to N-acetylglucosamine-1-phosphodiester alpha-N-acetylglucosaminidase [Luteitalea pratensis]|uniref:Exopolysaccharide biosynthesis protein related to N-acetylglucosamine-1-phosphodiester alpha-N-acetylglucosaminidase n=1 Tax=Luteitalea pratensis TaxID=1855912 RepID=A0A143PPN1_LUTPR|nr:phosphodiester glycosidase family protein [Luteitalea pratensis]AMY10113.1 Exopolysaccharide biosynthesis protein related to N-acetylglucosamine-1-phosphodiester alpha-N-acetylglucosaminidase [Luteitalea pratensis]
MSYRAARLIVASGLALWGAAGVQAQTVVTPLFPGVTHIKRTEPYPQFQCPGCPAPTPNPRLARMNILLIDLWSPAVHFKLTPPGENLPAVAPGSTTPNWPVVPFEVVRQRTLDFLDTAHAQAAINVHFFAPFPVPGGSTQGAFAYVIGLAASRGKVYSGFESSPIQSYAIVANAPGLNVDKSNNASIVHRDPGSVDGMGILEGVELWNALAGSGQILTNGVKTIPEYTDATHPDALLTPGPVPPLGTLPLTYTRAGRHWYDLSNARTAIGVTQDGRTMVLFTVDGTNGGHGMQVGEVADLLKNDYGVWNALNLDGGGSTTMAVEDPVTHLRKLVNVPAENPPRLEATNFAVYSDAVDPVTTAKVDPSPNANGWNQAAVSVSLEATDLASGLTDTPTGWVDLLRYSLAGAQTGGETIVPGHSASFAVAPEGVTTVSYFATDAAGNEETARTLDVKIDGVPPVLSGLPSEGCTLWPANHKLQRVAVLGASDPVSGIARGSFQVTATSNEPMDPGDVVVTEDEHGGLVVQLRAERSGGNKSGRIYNLTITAQDVAGNEVTATANCVVPHDMGKGK